VTRNQLPAAVAAAVLLSLSVSACGGPPADASKTEFCAVVVDRSWAESLSTDADGDEIVDALQSWGDDLEEVGTPEGIPDDARKGYEVTVDYLGDLEPDNFDDLGDVQGVTDDLAEDDQERVTAFNDYVSETCPLETPAGVPEPSTS
jgi:hypothetical protein